MREIKFRGLNYDGAWVYGDLITDGYKSKNTFAHIFPTDADEYTFDLCIQVKIESVGQYTGLKDKNGTDIYKGDIVIDQMRNFEKRKSIIELDSINPCFVLKRIDNRYSFTDYEYDFNKCDLMIIEVIGNIYENPELCKD